MSMEKRPGINELINGAEQRIEANKKKNTSSANEEGPSIERDINNRKIRKNENVK